MFAAAIGPAIRAAAPQVGKAVLIAGAGLAATAAYGATIVASMRLTEDYLEARKIRVAKRRAVKAAKKALKAAETAATAVEALPAQAAPVAVPQAAAPDLARQTRDAITAEHVEAEIQRRITAGLLAIVPPPASAEANPA